MTNALLRCSFLKASTHLRAEVRVAVSQGRNGCRIGMSHRRFMHDRYLRMYARFVLLAVASAVLLVVPISSAGTLDACTPPIANEIVCENSKPGNPQSEWDVDGNGDSSIQGFATDISVNHGDTISFKIKTTASAYRIDIYRLGWYGGIGARKVATIQPSASLPQSQPACLTNSSTGLIDCGNWAVSASWTVPTDAVSGVYLARPVRLDTGGASHIPFVVRDDNGHEDISRADFRYDLAGV